LALAAAQGAKVAPEGHPRKSRTPRQASLRPAIKTRFPGDPGARPTPKLMSEKLPQAIFPMD
ncbi:MAG: hypothetical protein WAN26_01760, partial [Steroidobacteraceae bacterium]